jgi:hypothetical protein
VKFQWLKFFGLPSGGPFFIQKYDKKSQKKVYKHREYGILVTGYEKLTIWRLDMKLKEAKAELKKIGMTITYNDEYYEYRVNFAGGKEATAYYTNDLEDAVHTGKTMKRMQK